MKSSLTILSVLLTASMAIAQTNATPATSNQPNGQSGQAQGQSGAKSAAPGGAQTQPPAGGSHVLQAKSQDELKAYQDASSKTDPAEMAAAADAFAAKFPDSELKGTLYVRAMSLYGQANNSDKLIEEGRKAIAATPTNPVPLVQVASVLAETTHDTDLDRDQRLDEAAKDAQAAIDNLNTGLIIPPNAPPERVAGAKASILTMAYDTLGVVSMNKKDYAAAEQFLLKAADASKSNPEAVVYLAAFGGSGQLEEVPPGTGERQQGGAIGSAGQYGAESRQAATIPGAKAHGGCGRREYGNACRDYARSGEACDLASQHASAHYASLG